MVSILSQKNRTGNEKDNLKRFTVQKRLMSKAGLLLGNRLEDFKRLVLLPAATVVGRSKALKRCGCRKDSFHTFKTLRVFIFFVIVQERGSVDYRTLHKIDTGLINQRVQLAISM